MAARPAGSTRPGHEACSGCSVCRLPCPVWWETHDPLLTVMGRARALQGGATAAELRESLMACVLCGACEVVCPEEIDTIGMTLRLRAELATMSPPLALVERARGLLANDPPPQETERPTARVLLPGVALGEDGGVLQATLRLLATAGTTSVAADDGRDIALAIEVGLPIDRERERRLLAALDQARTLVVADGLLGRLLRARLPRTRVIGVGEALLQVPTVRSRLRPGDLLVIEPRGYHAEFERLVRFYSVLRRETGCLLNLNLQRVALPTGAASAQARVGLGGLDVAGQVGRWLDGQRVERVVVEDLRDRAAFAGAGGVPVVHLAELT
jgi:ferredoxin